MTKIPVTTPIHCCSLSTTICRVAAMIGTWTSALSILTESWNLACEACSHTTRKEIIWLRLSYIKWVQYFSSTSVR
jgi:hypothetical protein